MLVLASFSSIATEKISIKLQAYQPNTLVQLHEVVGHNVHLIDSALLDKKGLAQFETTSQPTGFYQLSVSDTNYIDVILTEQEKTLQLVCSEIILQDDVQIIESEENQLLWKYKYRSKIINNELEVFNKLLNLLRNQQSNEASLQHLINKKDSLLAIKTSYKKEVFDTYPNFYFTKVMKTAYLPLNQIGDSISQRANYFSFVDFSDESLIRSSAFVEVIMEYLYNYTEYTEKGFQQSISEVLQNAKVNTAVYTFCLNFFINLFNEVGPDIVLEHVIQTYVLDGGCTDDLSSTELKELAEGYQKVQVGNKLPAFYTLSQNGDTVLYNELIHSEKATVLFFWSSHCSYCHETLPQLLQWELENRDKIQLVAISLDTDEKEWKDAITDLPDSWIHYSELKGWKSNSAKQLKIHKTPSYYIVNQETIIDSKPVSFENLSSIILR